MHSCHLSPSLPSYFITFLKSEMQLIVDGILDLMKWKKKHSPYEACIGKADKVKYKREKLKEFLFMNLDVVILNRILAN